MRKLTFLLALCTVILLSLTSTPRSRAQQAPLSTADDLKVSAAEISAARIALGSSVIGVLTCTLETEYHSLVANSAIDALKGYSLNAELLDSQADTDRQLRVIESFVAPDAKVLIV